MVALDNSSSADFYQTHTLDSQAVERDVQGNFEVPFFVQGVSLGRKNCLLVFGEVCAEAVVYIWV